jgi:hypothetical protein
MKIRIVAVVLLAFLAVFPLAAQISYESYKGGFQDFADGLAGALPLSAAVGLNWSDAYIGSLPHLGVAVTVGAATMPWDAFAKVESMLGSDIAGKYPQIKDFGAPVPAIAVEGRIGGLLLPFDVGVKVGFLPADAQLLLPSGVTAEYLMFGGDVRYALIKGGALLPRLSVGAGYTYLKGSLTYADVLNGPQDFAVGPEQIRLSNPDVKFEWEASVIDLKAQLSKDLVLFTPYAGVGASLAVTSAGGGLDAKVTQTSGADLTPGQIANIEAFTGESFNPSQGFFVSSEANGWSFRAFGGVSVNVLMLKLDLTAMVNLVTGTYGGSISGRFQI